METVVEDAAVPAEAGIAPAESVETSAPEPPSSSDAIDQLVQDYEAANSPAPKDEQPASDDWERQIAELLGPQSDPLQDLANEQAKNQIAELQGTNAQLLAERQREIDQRDFDKLAADLQAELPNHLPENHAANALWAAAARDPNLVAAFEARNLDAREAAARFAQLEALYNQLVRDPNPDARKQNAMAWLQQQGHQLGIIMNSARILQNAKATIVKQARAHPVYDDLATQTRMDVAAAVRGASAPLDLKEPEPRWGSLTDNELRDITRKWGF
jgi:hypothetical protein